VELTPEEKARILENIKRQCEELAAKEAAEEAAKIAREAAERDK